MHRISAPLLLLAALAGPAFAQGGAADKPPAPPADMEFLYEGEATSILGRQVVGPSGEVIGRIVDVLVGPAGVPRAAVIDFGGFMGLGNRRIAVTWLSLRFATAGDAPQISLNMTTDQIKAIPQFKLPASPADPPATVATPPRPSFPPAADTTPTPAAEPPLPIPSPPPQSPAASPPAASPPAASPPGGSPPAGSPSASPPPVTQGALPGALPAAAPAQ